MDKLKGIILAAGIGQRMNPLGLHKSLVSVYGKPLFLHQVETLVDAGVDEVIILTTKNNQFEVQSRVNQLDNLGDIEITVKTVDTSGFIDSFFHALGFVEEKGFIMPCDLIFDGNPLKKMSRSNVNIELLVACKNLDNRFCGANIKIQKTPFKGIRIDQNLDSFDFYSTAVFFVDMNGAEVLRRYILEERLSNIENIFSEKFLSVTCKMISFEGTFFDCNTPETLIRAEIMQRRLHNLSRATKVNLKKIQNVSTDISFTYAKSQQTRVIVKKNIINRLGNIRVMEDNATSSHHILITDENVDVLYGEIAYQQLLKAGYKISKLVVPAGEGTKSMRMYHRLAEKIVTLGIDEQTHIFALGGGVVANFAGFLAATLYRGINLVHIPTTFMNMIDVSISLKQAINGENGKNLVGSYYQPSLVLIDPSLSMPDWLVRDGLAEAIKHAICQDKDFFDFLINYRGDLSDEEFRNYVIKKTIELKIFLMDVDMFERREGMILQYGHEIGHAIEFLSVYNMTHGQSISVGMRVSAEIAKIMGVTGQETVDKHIEILEHFGLPSCIPKNMDIDAILSTLKYNKKNHQEEVRMVLPEFIGKVWKITGEYGIPCTPQLISSALQKCYQL